MSDISHLALRTFFAPRTSHFSRTPRFFCHNPQPRAYVKMSRLCGIFQRYGPLRETPMNAPHLPRLRLAAVALMLFVFSATARPAQAQQDPVIRKTLNATGFVVVQKEGNNLGYGTCWIVNREKRLVVTNVHVVTKYDKVKV